MTAPACPRCRSSITSSTAHYTDEQRAALRWMPFVCASCGLAFGADTPPAAKQAALFSAEQIKAAGKSVR